MLKGLLFALLACFVWGAIFVVPEFLSGFSTIEVVLARYLSFGLLSICLFLRKGLSNFRLISKKGWKNAFFFSLFSSIIYYFGLVIGVRFASAPLTVLVTGLAPILIALYGNWQEREISFKNMILPCIWIGCGLLLVNVAEVDWSFKKGSLPAYLFGMMGCVCALISWAWFAVENARFLKQNPQIPSTEWTTTIGVATFFWAVATALILSPFIEIEKFMHFSPELGRYLIGALILGFLCSWVGCYLWNRASHYLPVSLLGPFLIFESLFGLLFVYVMYKRLPTVLETIGALLMLSGILLSVRAFRKSSIAKSN